MRILVADDEATSRALLTGILEEDGHETVESVDGLSTWNALQEANAPELVILDWIMPGIDGIEVLRRLRRTESEHKTYVIMVTDKSERMNIVDALNSGADDYLSKPYDANELCARVSVGCRMLLMQSALLTKCTELSSALEHIKTLRGILPICAQCKKIRDDQGYWSQVEEYVAMHTEAEFTHGICPKCAQDLYPEIMSSLSTIEDIR